MNEYKMQLYKRLKEYDYLESYFHVAFEEYKVSGDRETFILALIDIMEATNS